MVFLSEDDFWAPFFALMEHTVDGEPDAGQLPRCGRRMRHSIEECFAALGVKAPA